MDRLLKALFQVQDFKSHSDDDTIDRLSRRYTPSLLVLCTVLVSVKQYVGDPIDCWCPAQFSSAHIEYTNTVCWVSNTYYVPFDDRMPLVSQPRRHISYYQWVPLILLLQSTLCFLPCLLWRYLNRRVGINISALVESGRSCLKAIYPETKDKTLRFMVLQLDSYLTKRHKGRPNGCSRIKYLLARHCCLFCSKFYGNYLTCTYMITKILYVINAIGQLFLLDIFLGMGDLSNTLYGFHVLGEFLSGRDWSLSDRFPRVTMCDFQIRQQTNVHRYTVQCVLPINLFNEKIFILLWFWWLGVAIVSTVYTVRWFTHTSLLSSHVTYVKRHLKASDQNRRDNKLTRRFTEDYLGRDGLLVVRIVAQNAGRLIAAELLNGLWANYGPEHRSLLNPTTKSAARPGKAKTPTAPSSADIDKGTRWNMVHRIMIGNNNQQQQQGSSEPDCLPGNPVGSYRPEEV